MSNEPVHPSPEAQPQQPEDGMALCLSGGGYRAMVFHIGMLWRLYDARLLRDIKRISSVSGGSITAGVLGMNWSKLSFDPAKLSQDFVPHVVTPLRRLASETIDANSVIGGIFSSGEIADKIAAAYDKFLFGGATLQALPSDPGPRFIINATNVQSGVLWRFSKPYMRDYRVGEVKNPTVALSRAVAASSAFPPVLSPCELRVDENSYTPGSGMDLQREPFTTRVVLTDGGVYDNLGLETAWKRYRTILVSDAGGGFETEEEPHTDWARHSYRVLNLIDNQVRALHKRQVVGSYISGDRKGAYWGIRTNIADYQLADAMNCPFDHTTELADTPTRLKRLDNRTQERLINWGYGVCDAALRKHVDTGLAKPAGFPYPASPV